MRLLIPTSDANGPESRMSGHFGRAPYYAVADPETGTVLSVANPSVTHGHGECVPATDAIGAGGFDAVVCHGIGAGAISRLEASGIPVFVHDGPSVASAIAAFQSSNVKAAGADDGCGGSGGCGGRGEHRLDD